MAVLVLSSLNSIVEEALVLKGEDVDVVVPNKLLDSRRRRNPEMRFHGISRWNGYAELEALANRIPNINQVFTVEEQTVRAAGFLRDLLGLSGQSHRDALAMTDKHLMKERARSHGIPTAGHVVARSVEDVRDAGDELGWPLVVKPRSGMGTMNTFKVNDHNDLERLYREGAFTTGIPDPTGRLSASEGLVDGLFSYKFGFMVEQFIDVVEEYFCDMVWHDGELLMAVPCRYLTPLIGNIGKLYGVTVLPEGAEEFRRVRELAVAAARALNVQSGYVHCELMLDSRGDLYFGEAGNRPGGREILALSSKVHDWDPMEVLGCLAMGIRPDISSERTYEILASAVPQAPAGRIVAMSDRDELLSIPEVVDVVLKTEVGVVHGGSHNSADGVAYIFFTPQSLETSNKEIEEIGAAFRVDVEPA
ncbi:hypothetical protein [Actinopolymorpha pittospori]